MSISQHFKISQAPAPVRKLMSAQALLDKFHIFELDRTYSGMDTERVHI